MRILRIITRLNIGGPSLQAIDLTREMRRRGHEVRLIAGRSPEHEGIYLEQRAAVELNKHNPYPFWILPSLQRELDLKKDWSAFRAIRQLIKDWKPDLIHSHMSKAGTLARLARLTIRKKNRPKMVHTFHGLTFEHYFSKPKAFIFRMIEGFLARYTDRLIAISPSQKKELIRYGFPADKIAVILLGFDLDRFLEIRK